NIYGVTKKRAEERCAGRYVTPVAILRCSRFFAEDAYDTSVSQGHRSSEGSNGNVKANELLCGVRASLEDMIMSHLRALALLAEAPRTPRMVLGPLVVSATSPLLEDGAFAAGDALQRLYSTMGWKMPDRVGRIIDSRDTWRALAWQPRWSMERLARNFEDVENRELIESGCY
ncbi:unnamed protein product, partial [Symbiodinium natans]